MRPSRRYFIYCRSTPPLNRRCRTLYIASPPPLAGEESKLFRFRFIDAVPIDRRRIGAIRCDTLDIHVVETVDVEAVGNLAAAVDQFERRIPLLLAVADQHLRVEIAQFPAMRVLLDLGAAEHRKHRLG